MPRPEDFEKEFDRFDPYARRDPTNTDDLWGKPTPGVCNVCGIDTGSPEITLCQECYDYLDWHFVSLDDLGLCRDKSPDEEI